jgi:predicted HicB family RNase H-like nuclease
MGYVNRKEIHLRVPVDLHAALSAEAERLGVSVNTVAVLWLGQVRDEKEGQNGP